jgi:hypothetical protein
MIAEVFDDNIESMIKSLKEYDIDFQITGCVSCDFFASMSFSTYIELQGTLFIHETSYSNPEKKHVIDIILKTYNGIGTFFSPSILLRKIWME